MHGRLILDCVGVFGHSLGGLWSGASAQSDDRVSTALLDHSGAFDHDALVNLTSENLPATNTGTRSWTVGRLMARASQ